MSRQNPIASSRELTVDTLPAVLPHYSKPPVVEVAISVQFDELGDFKAVHLGLLWERLRDRYPLTEYHPPLGSVVELFGTREAQTASISATTVFPVGRCWFLSEDKLRLVQVQPDRFVLNWRKLETEEAYPSYKTLRERFQTELSLFLEFIREERLGEFSPQQCELTYINHLVAGTGWRQRSEIAQVIRPWSGETSEPYLPVLEDSRLSWQYRFDENAKPLGRLHVQFQSGVRVSDRTPVFVLNLIGRGAPLSNDTEGVLAFTDRAHEWIVRGFTAITTERMHTVWERER